MDDAVGLQAVDLERDGLPVLAGGRARDGEALLVELGTAVLRRRAVAPLLDLVLARQVGQRVSGQGLGVLDLEATLDDVHRQHVEGHVLGEVELLQAVAQLAVLAPVAAGAEATDDQLAVVALEHAADTGLEALRHPEQRALLGAVDDLEVGALEAAVGDVADEHLAGVRAAVDDDGRARGVGDLVLRHPQHRLGDRLVVEATGRAVLLGGEVVVERVRLDLHQLRGREPATLVVGHEDLAVRTPAHAVRGAEAAGDVLDLAGLLVDGDVVAAVLRALRHGGGTTEVDGDRQVHVELAVLVEHAEAELVEVPVERVLGDRVAALEDAVGVVVEELDQAGLLGDVDLAVDDLDALRLLEAARDLGARHVRGRVGALDALEPVELAELHVALVVAVAAPGEDEQVVAHPLEAGDLRLEAAGPEIGDLVGGVHPVELEAVAGRVVLALAVLEPGSRDARDAGLGAEDGGGHDGERGVTGLLPLQRELLAATGLEEVDPQLLDARRQLRRAVLRRGAVEAVVVDDLRVVDEQLGAVVAQQPERVGAGGGDVEVGERLHDEVLGQAAEVLRGVPVDRRLEQVDVGGLRGLQGAELGDALAELVSAHGDAGLVAGRDGRRGARHRGSKARRDGSGKGRGGPAARAGGWSGGGILRHRGFTSREPGRDARAGDVMPLTLGAIRQFVNNF